MTRVRKLWEDAEHRLLVVQRELLLAKVAESTLKADLGFMEGQLSQTMRENETLTQAVHDARALQRETEDALEHAQAAERHERLTQAEMQLQLGQSSGTAKLLTQETRIIDEELAETTREAEELLKALHASALQPTGGPVQGGTLVTVDGSFLLLPWSQHAARCVEQT